jgi:hypothetical protein
MTDAFVIETERRTAGIAIRERSGFRFYAADRIFQSLDNRTFRGLRDLHATVDRCAAAVEPDGRAPRRAAGRR